VIALDTNILVHAHRADASLHDRARAVVAEVAESPVPWGICYHGLVEFYGVVTRSGLWDVASTPEQALAQIDAWQESPSLRVLHDTHESLGILAELAVAGRVHGAMIHDARIVACCRTHGVHELFTVDRDFSRFPSLKTRNPLA